MMSNTRTILSVVDKTINKYPLCLFELDDLICQSNISAVKARSLSELTRLSGNSIRQLAEDLLTSTLQRLRSTPAQNLGFQRLNVVHCGKPDAKTSSKDQLRIDSPYILSAKKVSPKIYFDEGNSDHLEEQSFQPDSEESSPEGRSSAFETVGKNIETSTSPFSKSVKQSFNRLTERGDPELEARQTIKPKNVFAPDSEVCGKPTEGPRSTLFSEEKTDFSEQDELPSTSNNTDRDSGMATDSDSKMTNAEKDAPEEKVENDPDSEDPYNFHECEVCGKVYGLKTSLTQHMLTHPKACPYICEICGRAYRAQVGLSRHIQTHGKSTYPYVCKVCGNSYLIAASLAQHVFQNHPSACPYVCEVCGMSYLSQASLSRHRRVHTREFPRLAGGRRTEFDVPKDMMCPESGDPDKPFVCHLCGKRYKVRPTYVRHMHTHSPDCPYACEFCSKPFGQISSLEAHKEMHIPSAEKMFLCDRCDRRFAFKSCLKKHVRLCKGIPEKSNGPNPVELPVLWDSSGASYKRLISDLNLDVTSLKKPCTESTPGEEKARHSSLSESPKIIVKEEPVELD